MDDLLDITGKARPVAVHGPAGIGPIRAFTDGYHVYFDDQALDIIAARLKGTPDLAGRPVWIERWPAGWQEQRGTNEPQVLHRRNIHGRAHYRLDEEWIFTIVEEQRPD